MILAMRISTKAAEAAKPGTKLTDDLVIPGGGALALVIKEKTKRWVIRIVGAGATRILARCPGPSRALIAQPAPIL